MKLLHLELKCKMKKLASLFIAIFFSFCPALGLDLPSGLKEFLLVKFPGIIFKIDNSFAVNNETFLPLIPPNTRVSEKIELVQVIQDKTNPIPRLLWFSNDWVFVRLIIKSDKTKTILELNEIPEHYKERFLKSRFPGDLVVPEKFTLKKELAALAGDLQIKILEQEKTTQTKDIKPKTPNLPIDNQQSPIVNPQLSGLLYLTSPQTGKIVYVDLNDLSMVNYIQTMGAPWELAFDKENKTLFVSDFARDQIYELMLMENTITKNLELPLMSSPQDFKLSDDGSLIYVLNSLSNDFSVYKTTDSMLIVKTKLPPNPGNLSILKDLHTIGITCPATSSLILLDSSDFSFKSKIMLSDNPEKIISDPARKVFYITHRNGGYFSIFNPIKNEVIQKVQVEETPTSLALDPSGKYLYVGNAKSNTISVVDLDTRLISHTISLPPETQFPGDIELSQDGNSLIVTSENTNTISIIDLAKKEIIVKLDVGVTTHGALVSF